MSSLGVKLESPQPHFNSLPLEPVLKGLLYLLFCTSECCFSQCKQVHDVIFFFFCCHQLQTAIYAKVHFFFFKTWIMYMETKKSYINVICSLLQCNLYEVTTCCPHECFLIIAQIWLMFELWLTAVAKFAVNGRKNSHISTKKFQISNVHIKLLTWNCYCGCSNPFEIGIGLHNSFLVLPFSSLQSSFLCSLFEFCNFFFNIHSD